MAFNHQNISHNEVIDGLTHTLIGPEHMAKAVDFFFDVFLVDEPATKNAGGNKGRHTSVVELVESVVKDGVSIMVLDKNGKMIAMRLSFTVTRYEIEIVCQSSQFCQGCYCHQCCH